MNRKGIARHDTASSRPSELHGEKEILNIDHKARPSELPCPIGQAEETKKKNCFDRITGLTGFPQPRRIQPRPCSSADSVANDC